MDAYDMILSLYRVCADKYQWSLVDIEATDFELLLDFLLYKDPNKRVINGKTYTRSTAPPAWL